MNARRFSPDWTRPGAETKPPAMQTTMIDTIRRHLRGIEPLLMEQVLAVNSIGILIYFIAVKPQFVAGQGSMGLLATYGPREAWALLIGTSAVLKSAGLWLCLVNRDMRTGLVLRTAGLAISGFWWLVLVISLAIGGSNEVLVGLMPMLTMALTALWVLVRSLSMPLRHG